MNPETNKPGVVAVWSSWSPQFLAILRIVTGFMFMIAGSIKLFAFPGTKAAVELMSLFGLAGVLEFFGGLLILLGLFTRPVAFILAGEMAVAYFMAHAAQSFWPNLNGGQPAVLYCFIFLYISAVGARKWSLDALRKRSQ